MDRHNPMMRKRLGLVVLITIIGVATVPETGRAQDSTSSNFAVSPALGAILGTGRVSFLPSLTVGFKAGGQEYFLGASAASSTNWVAEAGVMLPLRERSVSGPYLGGSVVLSTFDDVGAPGVSARIGVDEPLSNATAFTMQLRGYLTRHHGMIDTFAVLAAGLKFNL